jgi:hypothetical protein
MILYKKDGKEFLLMSNNSRGVMKIPTADFGTASAITAKVTSETGGHRYEKITAMQGIEQMDLLGRAALDRARARRHRPESVGRCAPLGSPLL